MQNYFIIDFKAVSLADKKFRNIIVNLHASLLTRIAKLPSWILK